MRPVQEAQEAPWNGPAAVKKLYLCNNGGEGWPHPDVDAQKSIAEIETGMAVLEEQNRNRVCFLKGDLLRPDNDIEAWIKGLPDVDAILAFNLSTGIDTIFPPIIQSGIPPTP